MADRRAPGADGFTLIEVLIAFAVLALTLAAAYGAIGSGAVRGEAAAGRLDALGLAESALARAAAENAQTRAIDGALRPGTETTRVGGWTVGTTVRAAGSGPWGALGAALWRIEAEVSGPGPSVRLTTLRPGPPP